MMNQLNALVKLLTNSLPQAALIKGAFASLVERLSAKVEGRSVAPSIENPLPLWELLGWAAVDLEVMGMAEYVPGMTEESEFDANFMALTAPFRDYCGKGTEGLYRPEDGVEFDLGADQWRAVDFLRAPSTRTFELPLSLVQVGPHGLGDGVVAKVTPERAGLPEGTVTALQVRGLVRRDSKVVAVYKGLVIVRPGDESIAVKDGYGRISSLLPTDVIEIHVMLDVDEYSPRGKVGMQSLYYEGAPEWETRFAAGAVINPSATDGGRLLEAGLPVRFLPVMELLGVGHQLIGNMLALPQGHRRKVVPAQGLKPGQFRAPSSLSASFQLGRLYVIHRDPALPDGSSSFSALCVGYEEANVFGMPSSQWTGTAAQCWEQVGGDFDGDDALVLPCPADGGVLMPFDLRPMTEQRMLLEASSLVGRKSGKVMPWADGRIRHLQQLKAARWLGRLDFLARRHIDLGNRAAAAALKPWIQVAVDRQKRAYPWPGNLAKLPKFEGLFPMEVLSQLRHPSYESEDANYDKLHWTHGYNIVRSTMDRATAIADGAFDGEALQGSPKLLASLKPVAQWALDTWRAIEQQLVTQKGGAYAGYPVAQLKPLVEWGAWAAAQRHAFEAVDTLDMQLDVASLELIIQQWRRVNPALARAAEQVVANLVAQMGNAEQESFIRQMHDFQLWAKVAPSDILAEFAEQFGPEFIRLGNLHRVVVAGEADRWVKVGREATYTGAQVVRGEKVAPGDAKLTSSRGRVNLLVAGVELASMPGFLDAAGLNTQFRTLASLVK